VGKPLDMRDSFPPAHQEYGPASHAGKLVPLQVRQERVFLPSLRLFILSVPDAVCGGKRRIGAPAQFAAETRFSKSRHWTYFPPKTSALTPGLFAHGSTGSIDSTLLGRGRL
jgi:hypothetical protein